LSKEGSDIMHSAVATTGVIERTRPSTDGRFRKFRGVVRSLATDANKALDDLEAWCADADQLERCYLVRHYLDYIARLCDGKV
jgi:hypothetical protein